MEVLKDYPKEFAKLFQPSFNFLSKINIKFSFENEGFIRKYWRFLYIFPCLMAHNATLGVHVAKLAAKGDIFEMANLMPHYLVTAQAIIKGIAMIPKMSLLTTILRDTGDLWRTTGLNELQISGKELLLKRVRASNGVIYWISIIGTLLRFITPLAETLVRRFLMKRNFEMLLPFEATFPFDSKSSWLVFLIVFLFQAFCSLLGVSVYVGPQLMIIDLCAIIGLEFTLLCEDILHAKPETKEKTNKKMLGNDKTQAEEKAIKDVAMRHQKLCVLSKLLDEAFNEIIFIDLLFAGMTTYFFIYAAQFSDELSGIISNYTAMAAVLLNILHICYYGEFLTEASLRVGESAYRNLWYIGNKEYQKTIQIIINRSQRPCCLTSMKYAPVNLNMFSKVMSTTWSYISLISTVLEKKT